MLTTITKRAELVTAEVHTSGVMDLRPGFRFGSKGIATLKIREFIYVVDAEYDRQGQAR